ncbi:MAG: M23 family metallopeptidase [Marinifilaceae bacterium]
MNIKTGIICLIAIFFHTGLWGKELPRDYFRSPVDFPITLSGNFGELRNNHFHSGIDIRTFTTGKRVYAAAQGTVSRIKISAGGYGKALYIDHPNGYTTVYAHLKSFAPALENYILSEQYRRNSFEIDIPVPKNKFVFKKGSLIAYSGNTGSSAGPHLHFEIRETKSEHPVNPLLFSFKIKDTKAPKIFSLYIYPLDLQSSINGKKTRQKFSVTYYDNAYHLKGAPKIKLHGKIGFALEANDYMNDTWSKCGIYSLQFRVDNELKTEFSIPEFSFAESRYINSHMDYQLNKQYRKRIHKCFLAPNNKLSIYKRVKDKGIIHFTDDLTHSLEFKIKDANRNTAILRFKVNSVSTKPQNTTREFVQVMPYNQSNKFTKDSLELLLPANCLYDTLYFNYKNQHSANTFYSAKHHIHNENTPVHKHFTLGIRPRNLPEKLQDKALVARIDKRGKLHNMGGLFFDGWVKTKIREFGNFVITVDTIAPTIRPVKKYKGLNLKQHKRIEFLIKDELSGIKSYVGEIDGKWVLFEYDAKKNKIFYKFDSKRLKSGQKHSLKLTITDHKDNKTHYTNHFIW